MKHMKRLGLFLGAVALVALTAGVVACNGVLGISAAAVEGVEAGDGGAVEAGLTCDSYCQLITQNCVSPADVEYQNDPGLCRSMCNNLALDNGTISSAPQNTLGCRVYYAQLAGTSDPATNCRFAGPLGGGHCGTKVEACGNFCSLDVPYCKSIGAPTYMSQTDCTDRCQGLLGDAGGYEFDTDGGPTGVDLPEGTNTLNCRFYHLENGYPSPARGMVHCPHTLPVSAVCN